MSPLGVLCFPLLLAFASSAHIDVNRLPNHRITGGVEVDIGSHPYQLTFQRSKDHRCGASIISKNWAVTAEHCIHTKKPSAYRLGAGSNHRYNTTFYNVKRIIRHPDPRISDIALLEIEGEFSFGENVQPIKLADRELKGGELVNVTGWGATQEDGESTDLLRGVTIPIVERETCVKIYKVLNVNVTKEMICAGVLGLGEKDACQGDSGGPLAANGILYGVVSWGSACGSPRYPGVYSNIAYLRSWITSITGI